MTRKIKERVVIIHRALLSIEATSPLCTNRWWLGCWWPTGPEVLLSAQQYLKELSGQFQLVLGVLHLLSFFNLVHSVLWLLHLQIHIHIQLLHLKKCCYQDKMTQFGLLSHCPFVNGLPLLCFLFHRNIRTGDWCPLLDNKCYYSIKPKCWLHQWLHKMIIRCFWHDLYQRNMFPCDWRSWFGISAEPCTVS